MKHQKTGMVADPSILSDLQSVLDTITTGISLS